MDKGAWQARVHQVTELDVTKATEQQFYLLKSCSFSTCFPKHGYNFSIFISKNY